MKLQSGHDLVPLSSSETKDMEKDWEGYKDGLVRLMPGRWLLGTGYERIANKIYNFQHKKSDIIVMTWSKCGTTWAQEIIWNMRKNPNLDNEDATEHLLLRSPFIEMDMLVPPSTPEEVATSDDAPLRAFREICPGRDPTEGVQFHLTDCSPEPRIIKTHLPLSLMAPSMLDTCKVIYVARNPKDVIVSNHHHSKIFAGQGFIGSFADFVQYFVDDNLLYGPYWLHVKEAWEKRNHPNLLFLFYEDLKANPMKELKKIDVFLGTKLTEEQVKGIIQYTSFEKMKARNATPVFQATKDGVEIEVLKKDIVKKDGGFFRKGESGGWRSKITPDLEAKIDEWIRKYLDPIGIRFNYGA